MTNTSATTTEPPTGALEHLESRLAALLPAVEHLRDLLADPLADADDWEERRMDVWLLLSRLGGRHCRR